MKLILALVLNTALVATVMTIWATAEPSITPQVRAARIELVDQEGRTRLSLVAEDKEPVTGIPIVGITLFTSSGQRVLFLGYRMPASDPQPQPMLTFYDSTERQQTQLYQTLGQAVFALRDSTRAHAMTMATTSKFGSIRMWMRENPGTDKECIQEIVTIESHVQGPLLYVQTPKGEKVWSVP